MDTRIFIENWPKVTIILNYMPLIVAFLALCVSLYSAHLSRKTFIASNRPYVWASSYGVADNANNAIIPVPSRLAYRIKNSPARIIKTEIKIILINNTLLEYTEKNFVRFPDVSSEWNFSIGKEEFEKIMKKNQSDESKLERHILIEYSSLNGGKKYFYILKQSFNTIENQWKDFFEDAN